MPTMKPGLKFSFTQLGMPLFILGLMIVIFLKVMENRNVNHLVSNNTRLIIDWEMQNRLLQVEKNQAAIETAMRIMTEDNNTWDSERQLEIIKQKENVAAQIESIQKFQQEYDNVNPAYDELVKLYEEKAGIQSSFILEYGKNNKAEAARIFNSFRYQDVNSRIEPVAAPLLHSDALTSGQIVDAVLKAGEATSNSTQAFAIGAIIGCLLICVYLIMKKKQSLHSEKKVKAAASVKENFLANMSHEIRTPLNAILGFTNILQKSKLDPQQHQHIQIIQTSGNNLLSIVNDILDLSKIEAGMMRIEEAPFRVADVMATVQQMLSPKAEEKNLQLIIKIDEEIPETVSGDAVRLTQVLVNLVSNSIKFTEEGGVYVRVTPYKRSGDSISLEFVVRDTGIGIPKDKQRFIFERFEQAEAETTRRFGGTGLGLSIVKSLIELQKGTITLNSEEGNGTSILVELPYRITNETVPAVKQTTTTYNPNLMNNNTCKILVAEDNIMNQHLIKHLLKTWGFEYDLVFNGIQAVEALKNKKYDMVLMDIQMPEMDGHGATKVIRNELRSAVPVIAMTAHAMAGEREKCINSGMNDYISKPIHEETLYNFIMKYAPNTGEQQSTTDTKAKVIDLKYIESFSEGNQALKDQMIREFVKRVPDSIATLEKAISEKNYTSIYQIAHDLKTTVHFLGLTTLIGHLLQKMEELATQDGTLPSINQMFGNVKDVCMRAVKEANTLVAA
jgi:CheY-like chemotaxis protein/nitrogen-specific signal transduction histidine kinase